MKKERIWELDAVRGLCIIGMMVIHFIYDIETFTETNLQIPDWLYMIQQYGHLLFVLISGICVTLGSRCVKRGAIVFAAGMLITGVTCLLDYVFHMGDVRIWFGILHLLGVCMMLYPLFKKLPHWALALIGAAFVALGYWFTTFEVSFPYLFPLGLRPENFFTGADYFPVFPRLGTFLLGAALGKSVYKDKKSLFPKVRPTILPALRFVGRHSLEFYILHQPVLLGLVLLIF